MLDQDQKKSLGIVLQNAGLISSEKLTKALKTQEEYPQMELEEILMLQEAIEPQTINFFVDYWPEIQAEGKQLLLGQYLQDAHLLNSEQVQFILIEQQKEWRLFGEIAVEQKWIKQDTINFFVKNLVTKVPRLVSFKTLEKYNQEKLHLGKKYSNHEAILTRILAWTGGHYNLSKFIAQEFVKADFNIPSGKEINAVDKFIESNLIQKWQNFKAGKYLRYTKYQLLNNKRQDSILLLETYLEILLAGTKQYDQSNIQNELLLIGLIVEKDNQVRPSNLIYKQIFHQDWITTQIAKLRLNQKVKPKITKANQNHKSPTSIANGQHNNISTPQLKSKSPLISNSQNKNKNIQQNTSTSLSKSNLAVRPNSIRQQNIRNVQNNAPRNQGQQNNQSNSQALEPITKLGSVITLFGIILFIPLVLIINNYYSPIQSNSPQSNNSALNDIQKLQEFCQDLNLLDPKTSLNLISQLENNKVKIITEFPDGSVSFPDNCEVALNKLRVLTAPQLGRENRVIEAVKNLCKVPADSESLTEAKIWIDNWYDSPDWGNRTQAYLGLTSECAANDR